MQPSITSGNVTVTLAANQYFVLGDNAPDSLDSRAFGPIQLNSIKGVVDLNSSLAKAINSKR